LGRFESDPPLEWRYPTVPEAQLQPAPPIVARFNGIRDVSYESTLRDPCSPLQKKELRCNGPLVILWPSAGTETPVSSSLKGVQHRMQSVMLVSAIIAGLAVSFGLAVLFLRIAFRLLGRATAD